MARSHIDLFRTLLYLAAYLASIALPTLSQAVAAQAYTPTRVACPSGKPLVRLAGTGSQILSQQEADYIARRKSYTLPSAWSNYLANVRSYSSANQLTLPTYVQQLLGSGRVPDGMTVGMAVSGGGYRAAIVGGGMINAFDGRNVTSVKAGTGGLLQGVSYLSGLSGGGWLVSALTEAGFPTFLDLAFGRQSDNSNGETGRYGGFLAQYGFLEPSSNPIRDEQYLLDVVRETEGKKSAGFGITLTDAWARVLSRHFVNGTTSNNFFNFGIKHGAGLLWSQTPIVYVLFTDF